MQVSPQSTPTWWTALFGGITEELRLRRMLTPARQLELNTKIKPQHKFNVSNTIYLSSFLLFNISLAALYVAFKDKNMKKTVKIPILFGVYSVLIYKLGVEWINREFVRKIESSQSEVGYYFRLKLIQQFSNNPLIKPRLPLMLKANRQYESIYNL